MQWIVWYRSGWYSAERNWSSKWNEKATNIAAKIVYEKTCPTCSTYRSWTLKCWCCSTLSPQTTTTTTTDIYFKPISLTPLLSIGSWTDDLYANPMWNMKLSPILNKLSQARNRHLVIYMKRGGVSVCMHSLKGLLIFLGLFIISDRYCI